MLPRDPIGQLFNIGLSLCKFGEMIRDIVEESNCDYDDEDDDCVEYVYEEYEEYED
nr:MAG TPA: hypothetical protein [Caudoviricetes sp.]